MGHRAPKRPAGRPEGDAASDDTPADAATAGRSGTGGRTPPRERSDKTEPEKARTDIAAGDVADDLADFA